MKHKGFSLIEMMMAIAILTLLIVLGLPSFTHFLQNLKIRTAAENFVSGLQLARSEAVRRNATVEFLLTSDDPVASNVSTATATAATTNWMVRLADLTTPTFIEGKVGAEASNSNTTPFEIAGATASIQFNNLGQATTGAATFDFSNSTGGSCAASNGDGTSNGGPMRCLRVIVSSGGQIRMCDPAVSGTTDSRRCS